MDKLKGYFLPYQRRWIEDESPMKLYPKSRRVGITFATSYRVNDKCLRRKNFTQWVTSRDELTAREFITDYVAMWARASNAVCKGLLGEHMEVIDTEHGIRAFTAEYGNGNRVVSLSSTPEAFAGKGGDILIDEADLHKDSGRVIDMALPCTTWGGQLEMVSALSVNGGPDTPFCRMIRSAVEEGNPMGWSYHRTSILEAVREGFVEKLNEVTGSRYERGEWLAMIRAKCRTEESWRTQYLIEPASDGEALLSYELIAGCEEREIIAAGNLPRYAGYDVGRKKDLGVYFELELRGDVLWQTDYRTFENAPFRAQCEYLCGKLKDSKLMRLCVDATGMGMMLAEELRTLYGEYRAEGVMFTAPVKDALAMPLKAAFEGKRLRICAMDELRSDLHKVRRVCTDSGNVRYEAERDGLGHADRFWALALALHAAGRIRESAPPPAEEDLRKRRKRDEYDVYWKC